MVSNNKPVAEYSENTSSVVRADFIKLVISSKGSIFESQVMMAFLISVLDNLYRDNIMAEQKTS